jgi:hypothetical protein
MVILAYDKKYAVSTDCEGSYVAHRGGPVRRFITVLAYSRHLVLKKPQHIPNLVRILMLNKVFGLKPHLQKWSFTRPSISIYTTKDCITMSKIRYFNWLVILDLVLEIPSPKLTYPITHPIQHHFVGSPAVTRISPDLLRETISQIDHRYLSSNSRLPWNLRDGPKS